MKIISDKKKKIIIEEYKQSSSKNMASIARKYKVSRSFVCKLLKSRDII